MPYPLQFRPNTTVSVFDQADVPVAPGIDFQLFRPLLAWRDNRLPTDFYQHNNAGGQLHRFVLQSDDVCGMRFGPAAWCENRFPYYTMDEDPLAEKWYITDGTVWDDPGGGERFLSGFASKRLEAFGLALPAPTADPAPHITTPLIDYGVRYSATIPATSSSCWRLDLRQQEGFTATLLGPAVLGGVRLVALLGSPVAPIASFRTTSDHHVDPLGEGDSRRVRVASDRQLRSGPLRHYLYGPEVGRPERLHLG